MNLKCSSLYSPANSLCDIDVSLVLPCSPAGLQSTQVFNVPSLHLGGTPVSLPVLKVNCFIFKIKEAHTGGELPHMKF